VKKFKDFFGGNEKAILGILGITVFLLAWQLIGERTNKVILPSLTAVLAQNYDLFSSGLIWVHMQITMFEFLLGFAIAIAIGIPIGMLMGWTRKINFTLDPLLSMTYAVPFVAIIPLIILWFGIDVISKIVTVVYISIFPIILNTMTGVRRADESLLKVGKSFGASSWKLFSTIVMPGAFPYVLSGLRLGLGRALVGAIGAELVASTAGLGWLIARYQGTLQTDKLLAVILIVALIGVVSTELLKRTEAHFEAWRTH
jgi:ABC-type nitrate/sulfonate/bicarbonate transport system permease component